MKQLEFTDIQKTNFFYPLIATLAFSIHGMNDIFARGFILTVKDTVNSKDEFDLAVNTMPFSEIAKTELKQFETLTPIILAPEFHKKKSSDYIYFNANKSAKELPHPSLLDIYNQTISIAEMIIIAGYQKLMSYSPEDSDILQFFRHIRNAAAHNGKFHFTTGKNGTLDKNGSLKKNAKWADFIITSELQNKRLFNESKSSTEKFWDIGDLIDFLLDLENHYPEIKKHLP